jgi:hypothetical protein
MDGYRVGYIKPYKTCIAVNKYINTPFVGWNNNIFVIHISLNHKADFILIKH